MPDISSLSSPLRTREYVNPQTYHVGKRVGSADTLLSRTLWGSYDKGLFDYENQQNTRYTNQGWIESVGNFAADLGVNTLAGVPSIIGSALSLPAGGINALMGGSFADAFTENPILNFAESMKTWGEEHFPHFQQQGFQDLSFLQQLTHPGQLAVSSIETLGFLTQSFGVAGLLGKASLGTKIANNISKGTTAEQVLGQLNPQKLDKLALSIDAFLLNKLSTTNEAALEALEARNSVEEKLYENRQLGLNNYSDTEIKSMADASLNNVFWLNMAVGAVTNGFFTKLAKPLFSKGALATRENHLALQLSKKPGEIAAKKELSKLESFFLDKGNKAGNFSKSLFTQAFSEGLEENIQYSIQRVNNAENTSLGLFDSAAKVAFDVANTIDFSDPERQKAAGLGALIGGGETVVASGIGVFNKDMGPIREAANFRAREKQALADLNSSFTDFQQASILKKTPAKTGKLSRTMDENGAPVYSNTIEGKTTPLTEQQYNEFLAQTGADETGNYTIPERIELSPEGVPQKDPVKGLEFAAKVKYQGELDNLIDLEASKEKADEHKIKLYQLSKLRDLATTAFQTGTTELLLEKLEGFKTYSPERLRAEGIESTREISAQIDEWKRFVLELESNYIQTQNNINFPLSSKEDSAVLASLKNRAHSVGARIATLRNVRTGIERQIQDLQRDIEPARFAEIQTGLLTDSPIKRGTNPKVSSPNESRLAELTLQRKDLWDSEQQLSGIYEKLINPKGNFQTYRKAFRENKLSSLFANVETSKDLDTKALDETSFRSYVNKRAGRLKQQHKLTQARTDFYSENLTVDTAWTTTLSTSDKIDSITSILEQLKDGDLRLYPEAASVLRDEIASLDKEIKNAYQLLEEESQRLFGTSIDGIDDVLDPEEDLSVEQIGFFEREGDFRKTKENYNRIAADGKLFSETLDNPQSIITNPFEEISDREVLNKVFDELSQPALTLLEVSGFYLGDTEYDDPSAVQKQLDFLKLVREKGIGRNEEYQPFTKKLDEIIRDLEELLILAKKNVNNKDLKVKQEVEFFADRVLAFNTRLEEPQLTQVNELAKTDKPLAAAATMDIIATSDPKNIDLIKLGLDAEGDKIFSELSQLRTKDGKPFLETGIIPFTKAQFDELMLVPVRGINEVLKKILDKEGRTSATEPLENFLKSYDVITFINAIDKYSGIVPNSLLRSLVELQASYQSLNQIEDIKNSSFNHVNFFSRILDFFKKNDLVLPSASQIRAVRDLATFVFSKSDPDTPSKYWEDVAALKAPAGAGKSLVVAKLLKEVTRLTNAQILTSAPFELAQENINKSLGNPPANLSFDALVAALENGTVSPDIKLIVFDEAGALSVEQLNTLSKALLTFNNTKGREKVKMVMLYDPNQVTSGTVARASLDLDEFSPPSLTDTDYYNASDLDKKRYEIGQLPLKVTRDKVPFVHNIRQLAPLSITYRSSVSEVVDLQNQFKTNSPVTKIQSSASKDALRDTTDIYGTRVERANNLAKIFADSKGKNPARTRVILVGNQDKLLKYQSIFPDDVVTTVDKAVGITVDEVYVDVQPSDSTTLQNNPSVLNQWMYTAFSRAKLFAYGTNLDGELTIDDKIEPTAHTKQDKQSFLDKLTEDIKTLEQLTGDVPQATPSSLQTTTLQQETIAEELEEDVETVTSDDRVLTSEEADVEIVQPSAENVPGKHRLQHPINRALSGVGSEIPPLVPGSRVIIVKDSTPKLNGDSAERFVVLQPIEEGSNNYHRIAVLSDKEVPQLEKNLGIDLQGLFPTQLRPEHIPNVFSPIGNIRGAEAFIDASSSELSYVYSENVVDDLADIQAEDGKVDRIPMLESYLQQMWGDNVAVEIENYDEVISNPSKFVKIVTFSSKKERKLFFPDETDVSKLPKLGPPYMIIHGLRTKNGKLVKNQYIKLTPKVLDSSLINTQPIEEFIQKLERFEDLLLRSNLGQTVSSLRAGKALEVNKQTYYPFHDVVLNLSRAFQTKPETVELTKAEELKQYLPDIPLRDIPEELLQLANDLDVLVHGHLEEGERRSYKGEAQKLMFAIGSQNLVVTLPNGKNLILRDYPSSEHKFDKNDKNGVSLLGPIRYHRGKGLAYNPLIKDELINRLKAYRDSLERRNRRDTARYKFVDELLRAEGTKHLAPVSLEDLRQLFINGKDSEGRYTNLSDGYGLRTPIPLFFAASNKTDIEHLPLEILESHFERVVPTNLVLSTSANQRVEKVERPVTTTTRRKVETAVAGGKTLEQIRSALSEQEIQELISNFQVQTLEEVFNIIKASWDQKQLYVTQSKNLFNTVKHIFVQGTPSRELIKKDFEDSLVVTNVGRNSGQISSRDFIRAAAIVRAAGLKQPDEIFTLLDLVRTNYFQEGKTKPEEFMDRLNEILLNLNISPEEFEQNLVGLQDLYAEVAVEYGVEVTPIEGDVFDVLEHLVRISSAVRGKIREGSAPQTLKAAEPTTEEVEAGVVPDAIPIPGGLADYLRKLIDSKSDEEFQRNLNKNKVWKQTILSRDSEDPLSVAEKLLEEITLERSKRFLTEDFAELSDEEVDNLVRKYTTQLPIKFLDKIFKRNSGEVSRMLQFGKLINSKGEKVWGLFKDGLMQFARLESGKVASSVVRHEVFHKIFWQYLTPEEQLQVLYLAKEEYGDLDMESLEEKLAEDFESFVPKTKPSIFSIIWNKLRRLLGFTFNNLRSIEDFFSKIESGAFTKQLHKDPSIERASVGIRANFDSYTEYSTTKALILEVFANVESARKQGRMLTYSEMLEVTLDRLQRINDSSSAAFPQEFTDNDILSAKSGIKKVLKNPKLWKNITEQFFGQLSGRAAMLKLLKDLREEEKQNILDQINELQGSLSLDPDNQEATTQLDDLTDELEEINLKGETFDVELVDPHTKLTGMIKQKLISIAYWKDGKKEYADLSRAFSIILEGVASIPKGSLKESLEAIHKNFLPFGSLNSKPNIRQAVANFMLRLSSTQLRNLHAKEADIVFRKDVTYKGEYAVFSLDGSSVENISTTEALSKPERYVVEPLETTLHDLIEKISSRIGKDYSSIATAFQNYEDVDMIKALLAAVSSLRQNRPLSFLEKWDFGNYKISNFLLKTGGGRNAHEANIVFRFSKYVQQRFEDGKPTLFDESLTDRIRKTSSGIVIGDETLAQQKKNVVRDFLKTVGIKKSLALVPEIFIDNLFSVINLSINNMESEYAKEEGSYESREEYLESKTGEALLQDESLFVSQLTEILNSHYTLSETHSYIRGDGKKAYGWIDASYQTDVLSSIMRARESKVYKRFKHFNISSDGKLSSSDKFLKDNIFFSGLNTLFSFNDFDSWKQKGNERWAKFLRKETLKDFRKRHIVGNFIGRLAYSGGKYYQALPIPSNRTTIQNVEVSALNPQQLDKAITQILNAQKQRPDPNSDSKLANNANYTAVGKDGIPNYKRWKFAGLSGSVDSMTVGQAKAKVLEHINKEVENLYTSFAGPSPQLRIPENDLERTAKRLGLGNLPKWKKAATEEELNAYWTARNRIVKEVLKSFYTNFIVNQYSISQFLYGDETFYKGKEDQTKRIQIVTATGDTVLIDDVHGLPKTSKVLIARDLSLEVPEDLEGLISSSYKDVYDASDAEGFMLPEFYEAIAKAYGTDALTDVVLKPVYFSTQSGQPVAIKYSVKVLTDALVEQFPHLKTYRDAMRASGASQMVFASAVKLGLPSKKNLVSLDQKTGELLSTDLANSVIEIDNSDLRFQLNPAADVDKTVANPSQGTAMQNTNGQNTAEIYELHRDNSSIIENGLKTLFRNLRLTRKGTATKNTESLLKASLVNTLDGLGGAKDVHELLALGKKGFDVSLSLPLIADRVITTIASMFTKATTGFRFEGSKLVLQADLGEQLILNPDGTYTKRKLEWRTEEGFAEVMLPESYRAYVSEGDLIANKNSLVGFRIPSTNYHSLVPLKVVGFYPVPPGSKGNVIIAPSLIVYYHGSDKALSD